AMALHGSDQPAQNSTNTGCVALSTSRSKFASFSSMTLLFTIAFSSDIFPFEQSQRPFAHVVHTEAVFAHHDGPRRRSAKAIHADDIAPVTNIAMPPLGYPRLDRKPRMNRWRQHRIAIRLRLGLKQFP